MADYTLFISKAPAIMRKLMNDFGFDVTQSAAVLGNIGHECAGFHLMQEVNPVGGGRGGYGWCQWTGPRRRAFEAYAARNGLPMDSDAANYGFLVVELRGSERNAVRRLKNTVGLIQGVRTFEQAFLRAGVKHYPSRERYAEVALAAFEGTAMGVHAQAATGTYWSNVLAEAEGAASAPMAFFEDEEIEEEAASPFDSSAISPVARVLASSEPTIHDTNAWRARPPRQAITLLPHRPKGIVIHHTTHQNTSDTSLPHAFSIARGIQAFHMGPERKWIDTGQHFTISRGGHIMEGRHRSLEAARGGARHVLGAHADAACNRDYVGIENEGSYSAALPPAAQWDALVALCVWLINQYGMSVAEIIGHRQCKSTECPGDRFFGALPQLRNDVAHRL